MITWHFMTPQNGFLAVFAQSGISFFKMFIFLLAFDNKDLLRLHSELFYKGAPRFWGTNLLKKKISYVSWYLRYGKKNSASLFPWIVLLKMVYKKKWKIQKFKKLRMNDVKKCDVKNWTFWCQNKFQFNWLNILYFQAKFGIERVEANKVILNWPNLPRFDDSLGPDGLPPLCYWSQQKTQKQINVNAKNWN